VKETDPAGVKEQTVHEGMPAEMDSDALWLERIAKNKGAVPPPLRLMALRPGTVSTFMAHRSRVLEGGPLGEKEKALLGVAVAVALKSAVCIRSHASDARKAGAEEDEIVQAALIAGLICGTSPLRTAFAGILESSD
jgi:AhpD family alkylhydroperoxidase